MGAAWVTARVCPAAGCLSTSTLWKVMHMLLLMTPATCTATQLVGTKMPSVCMTPAVGTMGAHHCPLHRQLTTCATVSLASTSDAPSHHRSETRTAALNAPPHPSSRCRQPGDKASPIPAPDLLADDHPQPMSATADADGRAPCSSIHPYVMLAPTTITTDPAP